MKPVKSIKKQAGFIDALISGGASLLGGFLTNQTNADIASNANQLSIQQAREARAWQDKQNVRSRQFAEYSHNKNLKWMANMSNTAHRREVADLKAAGLNPILSAKLGGASSPSAPSAVASSTGSAPMPNITKPSYTNAVGQAVTTALTTRRLNAEVKEKEANAKALEANAKLTSEKSLTEPVQRDLVKKTMDKMGEEIHKLMEEAKFVRVNAAVRELEGMVIQDVTLPKGKLDQRRLRQIIEEVDMELKILRQPRGAMMKEMELWSRGSSAAGIAGGALVGGALGIKKSIQIFEQLRKRLQSYTKDLKWLERNFPKQADRIR